jgi:hypothetical protein
MLHFSSYRPSTKLACMSLLHIHNRYLHYYCIHHLGCPLNEAPFLFSFYTRFFFLMLMQEVLDWASLTFHWMDHGYYHDFILPDRLVTTEWASPVCCSSAVCCSVLLGIALCFFYPVMDDCFGLS